VTADQVIRILVVKGYATPESAAAALLASPEETGAILDRLVADGLAELWVGQFRLTADGKAVAAERIAEDRACWGAGNAVEALDAFIALDHRMKDTVTAWQMRDVGGTQTFNDHSDAAYDTAVLDRLDALHADARAWLAPLAAALPRLAGYGERLERAAAAARGGDHRYVASPRVDSYHSIWFELHEDLILLAGRSRAEEAAAGRA
jgi:pyruvate,orthophosphate dikinase